MGCKWALSLSFPGCLCLIKCAGNGGSSGCVRLYCISHTTGLLFGPDGLRVWYDILRVSFKRFCPMSLCFLLAAYGLFCYLDKQVLEHFNIFCSHLGRREDEAGKEDCTAILKYCEQI